MLPDGVNVSLFRCLFPWTGTLDGIEISYFESNTPVVLLSGLGNDSLPCGPMR